MSWLQTFVRIFKIHDLRTKILFIFGVFLIFRVMANIPIPGVQAERLKEFFASNQVFGLLNAFTGGALDNLSIVMLGLGPYITATIVLQLLTMVFPRLNQMYKEEGEAGRAKFNQYGRMLTIPFALIQGYGLLTLLSRQGIISELSLFGTFVSLVVMTAGTLFLMWLGELISEKGLGNGVSLLIFAGIIAEFPNSMRQIFLTFDATKTLPYLAFFVSAIAIIAGVVLVTEARRNIPVSYTKRVRGNKLYGGIATYLPLSVNPAGVIPIIFALSILTFPGMIASFFQNSQGFLGFIASGVQNFVQNQWAYGIAYFVLVIIFTYFYTAVTFDPKAISSNLQKSGGFVPGVRPGPSTAGFLSSILTRVLIIGALFLGTIAVLPSVVGGFTGVQSFQFLVGGTSLLIVVSVVLETIRQLRSQLQMRDYESF
ncbi:MAG: preprotein translocase subunit SecY [Parcubacteria group bacterium Greene0416_39]|nr:MAG: preprotein translocase subunit SecY [Parcubacteria group bacterium Greene0416_39]TSC97712.1 MAG: preprotein translocase subunit SecY [Parcubacteria group bacterium Greene1014_47]